ncbi:LAGLIDADG family homing endonuclease [Lentzea sp. JNUCC 0626]|uniref:LAGLIDADG family homing endonuclease n=1 Tax=Lentzea sp. JNUCC 0626 TaxID=3367513 RepID=UPI003748D91B
MSRLDKVDAAWLAGLLDGEGCFDLPRGNPRVRVKMSDLDVILRAADLMGAKTYPEVVPGRKPLLVAQITGDAAVEVLRAVLPFLGSRRSARATEIILAHEAKGRPALRLITSQQAA